MAYFGDDTPYQELLDSVEHVQSLYGLSQKEIESVLIRILLVINDPVDDNYDFIKQKKREN